MLSGLHPNTKVSVGQEIILGGGPEVRVKSWVAVAVHSLALVTVRLTDPEAPSGRLKLGFCASEVNTESPLA